MNLLENEEQCTCKNNQHHRQQENIVVSRHDNPPITVKFVPAWKVLPVSQRHYFPIAMDHSGTISVID